MDIPTNPLFWLVAFVTLAGYVGTLIYLYSRRRGTNSEFHSGRVPGYSYTAGHNVGLDASVVELPEGDWFPTRLETLHTGQRTRLILSLSFQADPDRTETLRAFLTDLAGEVQDRSEADVVYLQARHEPEMEGRWECLVAPDGQGWWGREPVRTAYRTPRPDGSSELT